MTEQFKRIGNPGRRSAGGASGKSAANNKLADGILRPKGQRYGAGHEY